MVSELKNSVPSVSERRRVTATSVTVSGGDAPSSRSSPWFATEASAPRVRSAQWSRKNVRNVPDEAETIGAVVFRNSPSAACHAGAWSRSRRVADSVSVAVMSRR
jgi:hypothetical protein